MLGDRRYWQVGRDETEQPLAFGRVTGILHLAGMRAGQQMLVNRPALERSDDVGRRGARLEPCAGCSAPLWVQIQSRLDSALLRTVFGRFVWPPRLKGARGPCGMRATDPVVGRLLAARRAPFKYERKCTCEIFEVGSRRGEGTNASGRSEGVVRRARSLESGALSPTSAVALLRGDRTRP